MEDHQLAQINIALPVEPLTAPRLAGFVAAIDEVNALADTAPGFIWRLRTEDGDATAIRGFGDDRIVVNMSVWTSPQALADFVYSGDHLRIMRRRREWFTSLGTSYQALWWVPAGHQPTVAEAEDRVAHLNAHGPGPYAFTFRHLFPASGQAEAPRIPDELGCPA